MTLRLENIYQSLSADPRSVTPCPKLVSNGLVGVEIELENCRHPIEPSDFTFWSPVRDGSLRNNGIELINRAPLGGMDFKNALTEVTRWLVRYPSTPETNFRTGLHVHVDVRDISLEEMCVMVGLYIIFEDALFVYADRVRKRSNFCTSIPYSKRYLSLLSRLQEGIKLENHRLIDEVFESWDKYTGINLASVRRRGSLEFRQHPGTVDPVKIMDWTNILLSLKEAAIRINTTGNLRRVIQKTSPRALLHQVFGDRYSGVLDYYDLDKDVSKNGALVCVFFTDRKGIDKFLKSHRKKGDKAEKFEEPWFGYGQGFTDSYYVDSVTGNIVRLRGSQSREEHSTTAVWIEPQEDS